MSLKILGLGAAGGTLGSLILGAIALNQLGQAQTASMLIGGVMIFVVAGAVALVMRAR